MRLLVLLALVSGLTSLASGVYSIRMETRTAVKRQKVVLVRRS